MVVRLLLIKLVVRVEFGGRGDEQVAIKRCDELKGYALEKDMMPGIMLKAITTNPAGKKSIFFTDFHS